MQFKMIKSQASTFVTRSEMKDVLSRCENMKFQLGKPRWHRHIVETLENNFLYRQTVNNCLSQSREM